MPVAADGSGAECSRQLAPSSAARPNAPRRDTGKKDGKTADRDADGILDERRRTPFKVRSDFSALAAFLPRLVDRRARSRRSQGQAAGLAHALPRDRRRRRGRKPVRLGRVRRDGAAAADGAPVGAALFELRRQGGAAGRGPEPDGRAAHGRRRAARREPRSCSTRTASASWCRPPIASSCAFRSRREPGRHGAPPGRRDVGRSKTRSRIPTRPSSSFPSGRRRRPKRSRPTESIDKGAVAQPVQDAARAWSRSSAGSRSRPRRRRFRA